MCTFVISFTLHATAFLGFREAASKAGAGECLKHIDSFVWQTQMDILRDSPDESPLQLTELKSTAPVNTAGDWILSTRQPVTKSPRIRRMNTAPCASPTKKRKTIRKARSSAPSSTRALRNLSIISGSRVKALLRKKYDLLPSSFFPPPPKLFLDSQDPSSCHNATGIAQTPLRLAKTLHHLSHAMLSFESACFMPPTQVHARKMSYRKVEFFARASLTK